MKQQNKQQKKKVHSIRGQFAWIFIGLMIGTILLCLLLNYMFLGRVYMQSKLDVIHDAYETIKQAAESDSYGSEEFAHEKLSPVLAMYRAKTFDEALYKAFIGAGVKLPKHKNMIMTVRDEDKEEAVEIGRRFEKIGYKIFATEGTAKVLTDAGVKAMTVNKIEQESPNLMDLILGHKIDLVIDTPPQGADHSRDGFVIRRNAIETGVNVLTAIDTAKALITSLENTDIQKLTLIDIAKIK